MFVVWFYLTKKVFEQAYESCYIKKRVELNYEQADQRFAWPCMSGVFFEQIFDFCFNKFHVWQAGAAASSEEMQRVKSMFQPQLRSIHEAQSRGVRSTSSQFNGRHIIMVLNIVLSCLCVFHCTKDRIILCFNEISSLLLFYSVHIFHPFVAEFISGYSVRLSQKVATNQRTESLKKCMKRLWDKSEHFFHLFFGGYIPWFAVTFWLALIYCFPV